MTSSIPANVDGVGQPGFVARYGLYTEEQTAAANTLADQIRAEGLRTVRLIVVDQHGMPRGKALAPDVAIAAMRNGLDFSGAIYSLDTGNQVFVPAFAAGGGFGIDEFTGFPDIVLVPDPSTFRILPWADSTGWMLCDTYFSNGQPMPLDGRGLMPGSARPIGINRDPPGQELQRQPAGLVVGQRELRAGPRLVLQPAARPPQQRVGRSPNSLGNE